jgi:signal transduction histidine kinase/CheY-like chemotaxis protein
MLNRLTLKIRGVLFLVLVTASLGACFYMLYSVRREAEVYSSKVTISTRQRSLADEMAREVLELHERALKDADVSEPLRELNVSLDKWRNAQKALVNGSELYGISADNSQEVQKALQAMGTIFVKGCDGIQAYITEPSLLKDRAGVNQFLRNQDEVVVKLNDITGMLMSEAKTASSKASLESYVLLGSSFLLILFGYLFLFHPLFRRIDAVDLEKEKVHEELEQAEKVKTEFLANMSHEVRTPLNGVIGMSELLLKSRLDEEQRSFVRNIHSSALNLLDIVNDLLDYSTMESGNLEVHKERFVLSDCVEQVIDLMKPLALGKQVEVMSEIGPDVPFELVHDERRLRQVLMNLVNNAIKFTEKGEVVVKVEFLHREADFVQIRFSVRDTGIGIEPSVLPRLFQSFSQADTSINRKYGGSGLGLAICKGLVQQLGGHIWVESTLGKGSTFFFTLVAETTSESHVSKIESMNGLRALVVDDNKTNLKILVRQLGTWGIQATPFNSPDLVSEIVNNMHKFDFCIMDMQMPEMDGRALAEKIREKHDMRTLPIIVLSSVGQHLIDDKGYLYNAYLTKPVRQTKLLDTIVEVMGHGKEKLRRDKIKMANTEVHLPSHRLKILIAHDNELSRAVTTKTLQLMGHRFDSVTTGAALVEQVKKEDYDMVIMDIDMSDIKAPDAVRKLKKQSGKAELPLFIAVSDDESRDRKECLQAGITDLWSRPLKPEIIESKISAFFDEH